jgi:hypothetical protein
MNSKERESAYNCKFQQSNNYGTIKYTEIYVEEFYILLYNTVQSVENQQTLRRICRLHLQGQRRSQAGNELEGGSKQSCENLKFYMKVT